MYWLRWQYHAKDIAGAPYRIKKKSKQKRQHCRQSIVLASKSAHSCWKCPAHKFGNTPEGATYINTYLMQAAKEVLLYSQKNISAQHLWQQCLYHVSSVCPPFWCTTCCWRRLHSLVMWSLKRSDSLRHSSTIAFFSRSTVTFSAVTGLAPIGLQTT